MSIKKLAIFAILALFVLPAAFSLTKDQARRKSRHYYLQGATAEAAGRFDEATEYYLRAAIINQDSPEAYYSYGLHRSQLANDTLRTRLEFSKSISLMKKLVDSYPGDFDNAMQYAVLCSMVGDNDEAIRVLERTNALIPDRTETLLKLYELYMNSNQTEKGIKALTRYEEIEGYDPEITLRKVGARFALQDTVGAIDEVARYINREPTNPRPLLLKGNLYEMIGSPDSARYYYEAAERLDPDFGSAKLALADLYNEQGDSVAYDAKIYDTIISEDFELADKIELLRKYLSSLLAKSSDKSRADHLFEVLREQYPHSHELLALSAQYNAAQENFQTAIDEMQYAIDQAPTNEAYRYDLMRFLIADKHPADAVAAYNKAKEVLTPSPTLINTYAMAQQMAGDNNAAAQTYRTLAQIIAPKLPTSGRIALRDIPRDIRIEQLEALSGFYTSIGDCMQNTDSIDQAVDAYENALILDPQNNVALNNYAFFLTKIGGDLTKALELSRASLAGEYAQSPVHLDTYAWILFLSGNIAEARTQQALAIKIAKEKEMVDAELFTHYAEILAADGAPEEALIYYNKALELDPKNKTIIEKIKLLKNEKK